MYHSCDDADIDIIELVVQSSLKAPHNCNWREQRSYLCYSIIQMIFQDNYTLKGQSKARE